MGEGGAGSHVPPTGTRYGAVDPSTGCMDLPMIRPAEQGDQVFLSYGLKPNATLLMNYGFVIQDNPHDVSEALPESGRGRLF